ncbi:MULTISPECIES: helix-turn-helix transcriptional regulator [unclassified Faecalibacterium]|uniref:helix-turn-helix transcriptional regulator n=1 Tax=unclassified Faecalibacterium TaxID=2646395 RepID=UPI002694F046
MKLAAIEIVGMFLSFLILAVAVVLPLILLVLCIRALWIYIKTHTKAQEVKKETAAVRKTLAETLKDHRTRCRMTQEFVAESLGVSRQAVSKWETGDSDPSMSNLVLLAKLYGVPLEELLQNVI